MTCIARPRHVERFRSVIAFRMGLQFDDARLAQLGEVLQRRLEALGAPADEYLARLEAGPAHDEIGALARVLTVGETYLFRNAEQFRALAEIALPARLRARRSAKTLRIVSAGCSTGEEPYSVAIIVRETVPDPAWKIAIRAVDLNPAALATAAKGRFSPWALRETSSETRLRWFRADGRDLVLDEEPRAAVTFEQRNLAGDDDELWAANSLDIVFCRNVTMYFAPEHARALIARIARALLPGGYLFLGHAETLRGVSEAFHLRHTHGTFYYQRKAEPAIAAPGPPASVDENDAWFDAIRRASDRVAALTMPCIAADVADVGRPRPQPAWEIAPALELLRADRLSDALAAVRARPASRNDDPEPMLLEAILLAQRGEREAAEEHCRRLLACDELNAGAHYIMALCRDSAGDDIGAAEHDRIAAYLDPGFAMPRLHLGLLASRAGARNRARRELSQALVLLRREDAARLLMFGGGFGRNALIALCEAALRGCGRQA
jgi:chemotaxis protein methyltransferase CheR